LIHDRTPLDFQPIAFEKVAAFISLGVILEVHVQHSGVRAVNIRHACAYAYAQGLPT
jgi:hypothetical protein